MTISITVTAATQAEYKEALRTLIEGSGFMAFDLGDDAQEEVKPAPQAATGAPNGSTVSEEAPAPKQQAAPTPAPKQVTIEDLQAAGRRLTVAGKLDLVGEALAKYGAKRMSELGKEHYAAVLAELNALLGETEATND